VAVIGIDDDGYIALANSMALHLLDRGGERPLLGELAKGMIPDQLLGCSGDAIVTMPDGVLFHCWQTTMGRLSHSHGVVLAFAPQQQIEQASHDA
jgi:hypothetical protein